MRSSGGVWDPAPDDHILGYLRDDVQPLRAKQDDQLRQQLLGSKETSGHNEEGWSETVATAETALSARLRDMGRSPRSMG